MEKTAIEKVIIYVIQDNKLLLFRHVDYSYEEIGIQVPAGTIEKNELPEVAALCELREETKKDCFEIVSKLGTTEYNISPYRNEVQERHFFLAKVTDELPERWAGAEGDTKFEFFWIPLTSAHVLQSGQGALIWKVV